MLAVHTINTTLSPPLRDMFTCAMPGTPRLRALAVKNFVSDPSNTVFLVTARVQDVSGLTLVAANRVFLMEPR